MALQNYIDKVGPVVSAAWLNLVDLFVNNNIQTSSEVSAGVVPVNTGYPPGDIRRYGGDPTGVADSYTAFVNAFASATSGGTVYAPAGNYKFLTAFSYTGTKAVALNGDGAYSTILNYAGASTTNDCFTFGNGTNGQEGMRVRGIQFNSLTNMTAGALVHYKKNFTLVLYDVAFGEQNNFSNIYHGLWLDKVDSVELSMFFAFAEQDCIRINGTAGGNSYKADCFLNQGKIANGTVGLHVGGAFGGLVIGDVDIINNKTNMLVDKTLAAEINRELFFSSGILDSACTTNDAATFDGINLDIQDTDGYYFFNGTWNASCGTNVRVGANFVGTLNFSGGTIFNAFTTFGGNGNGIMLLGITAKVVITGTRFVNIMGTAIICTAVTPAVHVVLNRPSFYGGVVNVLSNVNQIGAQDASPYYATTTSSSPGHTILTDTLAIGNFLNNASPTWLEFSKSRGGSCPLQGVVQDGDAIGSTMYSASDGTALRASAEMVVNVKGAVSPGHVPSQFTWIVTSPGGSPTPVLHLSSNLLIPEIDNSVILGAANVRFGGSFFTQMQLSVSAPVVGAGCVGYGSTTATTVGGAGGAAALPATPVGYLIINVAGNYYKVPYFN